MASGYHGDYIGRVWYVCMTMYHVYLQLSDVIYDQTSS